MGRKDTVGEQATDGDTSGPYPRLRSVRIKGYRPFRDFSAELGSLEVIVGANGSGKSALFEFLRFLRDGMDNQIPPGIVPEYAGEQVFHLPGADRFEWDLCIDMGRDSSVSYKGTLMGPMGSERVTFERVEAAPSPDGQSKGAYQFLNFENGKGVIRDRESPSGEVGVLGGRQLALNQARLPDKATTFGLREYISSWRFYGSFGIARDAIRRAVIAEQEPVLREDMANLSSVLLSLKNEHPAALEELEDCLRTLVPSFRGIPVRIRGQGQVMAYWQEGRSGIEFSLADLSDGLLRLICWTLISVQPDPPPLICIDEPELGLHPRTLPVLAALFDRASERTQIVLATHSSYFLTQFDISRIAVMRKEDGEARFAKPRDSKALTGMLEEFGPDEIEAMHRSDELEFLESL